MRQLFCSAFLVSLFYFDAGFLAYEKHCLYACEGSMMQTRRLPTFINIKVLFYNSLVEPKFASRYSALTILDTLVLIALNAPLYQVMFWILLFLYVSS